MNVIFLPEPMQTSLAHMTSSKLEFIEEEYQPMDAINNFHDFFSSYDRGPSAKKIQLRIDVETARQIFWDRQDFIDVLKRICVNDVYVQANTYSLTLGFVDPTDKDTVKDFVENPKMAQPYEFSDSLLPEVHRWLNEQDCEYRYTKRANTVSMMVRDPMMAELMVVKFRQTVAGDHYKENVN